MNKLKGTTSHVSLKVLTTSPGTTPDTGKVVAIRNDVALAKQPYSLSLSAVFYVPAFTGIGVQYYISDTDYEVDAESSLSILFLGKSCHFSKPALFNRVLMFMLVGEEEKKYDFSERSMGKRKGRQMGKSKITKQSRVE